ncbi:hypothetical protein BCR37DRAFT_390731 [Protomyces lactucae-debilis]|uniref:Uncharacterized protein n=1 Tax=Protomyces lactucae-debilis TaxID=2754530 RepID=A0A1Y2FSP4_PROLT|nr:uncharacterized protein BCR37DRAFT_390731 [Protomyces lactucae-debilis]ORY87013.1 hypothetical protein BCR37DRAFT_390731 [Protomyces lactucae-debilis]
MIYKLLEDVKKLQPPRVSIAPTIFLHTLFWRDKMHFTLVQLTTLALLGLSASAAPAPDGGPFVNSVRPVAGAPGEYSGAAPVPAPIVPVPAATAQAAVVQAASDAPPAFVGDGPQPAVLYNPANDDSARVQAAAAAAAAASTPVAIAPIAPAAPASAAGGVINPQTLVQPAPNAAPVGDASAIVRAAAASANAIAAAAAVAAAASQVAGKPQALTTTAVAQPRVSTAATSSTRSVRTVNMTTTLCSACGVPTATVVANAPVVFTGAASSVKASQGRLSVMVGLAVGAIAASGLFL